MSSTNPPETPQPEPPSQQGPSTISVGYVQAINLCAVALGACFFAPWMTILWAKPSGFDFQKTDQSAKLLWCLPIFSAITLCAGLMGKSQKEVAQLAGITPFIILGYGLSQSGKELIDLMAPGAWAALVLGGALFVLARR